MSEAMREAFEALDNLRRWADDHPAHIEADVERWTKAVKAALSGAQQGESEPVAGLIQVTSECFQQVLPWDEAKRQHAAILSASETLGSPGEGVELIPLYTAPQSAQVPELLPSVREYLQQGIYDATHCEDADMDHAFAKQLHELLTAAPSGDAKREAEEPIKVDWPICNPACDPSLNGGPRSRGCVCEAARASIERQSSDGDDSEEKAHG